MNYLAALEEKNHRDVADTILSYEILTLVNIILANDSLALILLSELLDDRSKTLTWATLGCPEVN